MEAILTLRIAENILFKREHSERGFALAGSIKLLK